MKYEMTHTVPSDVLNVTWGGVAPPLCTITIAEEDGFITDLRFCAVKNAQQRETPVIKMAFEQVFDYFEGRRKAFELPFKLIGTPFQRAVWQALCDIPYGETRSYGQIAAAVGNPKACRAVGMANNKNPISIIVPCHRVIGADGRLVGYGGGLHFKQALLALEQKYK